MQRKTFSLLLLSGRAERIEIFGVTRPDIFWLGRYLVVSFLLFDLKETRKRNGMISRAIAFTMFFFLFFVFLVPPLPAKWGYAKTGSSRHLNRKKAVTGRTNERAALEPLSIDGRIVNGSHR